MTSKHYIVIILLTLFALGLSYLLMPHQQEIALMQMKDKHFDEARATYEQQLATGNLNVEVVTRLSELYLQIGAVDKAIDVIEKYLAVNPNNMDLRTKLGTYYQYAQRQEDYLRNLEEINRLQPSAENLKILSDIYNFNKQYDKQAEILKQIVDNEDKTKKPETTERDTSAQYYADLANIYAVQKSYKNAIDTLQAMKQYTPADFKFAQEEMLVTLLFDAKRSDEAVAEAAAWIKANLGAFDAAARLINIVHYRGSVKMAKNLLSTHYTPEQINANPALFEENTLIMLADGKDDEVYEALKKSYAEGKISSSLRNHLLYTAVTRNDDELAKRILKDTGLASYSEADAMSLTELAVTQNKPWLLGQITQTFPPEQYKDSYPALSAMLGVSNNAKDADAILAKLDSVKLNSSQALQMARICARHGKSACTQKQLASLPAAAQLSDAEVANIGNLYLDIGQSDKGYAFLSEASKGRNSMDIDQVMVKYDAMHGNTTQVEEWLMAHVNTVTQRMTGDLFFTALNHKHYITAVSIAEFANERDNNTQTRGYLANAYMKTGQYAAAVKVLRDNKPMSEADEEIYLTSLVKLSKNNNEYRKELTDFAAAKMHSNISKKQKMALVYAMIAAHETNIVMPYIRELALSEGGQWSALYAENLDKQGKHEEANKFWLIIANQSSTPVVQKRQIAYTLLDNGDKKNAVKILTSLAENAKPDSTQITELLYLWGRRPLTEQMDWLETRYKNANTAEKAPWAGIIGDYASKDYLVAFVERNPESTKNPGIIRGYMQALLADGTFPEKSKALLEDAKSSGNVAWLREYAQTANANGMPREARQAYEAIIVINPNDYDALREAGIISYSQADYSASELLLGQYLQREQPPIDNTDYNALFYYAELLRTHEKAAISKPYYADTIKRIDSLNLTDATAQSIKAQSQIWLGDREGGMAAFDAARIRYPDNDVLRADMISMLIELKHYDEARNMLAGPLSFQQNNPSTSVGLPENAAEYTLTGNNTELFITFPPAIKPERIAQSFNGVIWVQSIDYSYDSVLVTALPGYVLKIDSAGETPVIHAVAQDTGINLQNERQIALRYELLKARADVETGHIYNAASRLNALAPEYKNDTQLLGFIANVENYGGNWPRAQQLLKTAREMAPENEDLAKLDHDMRRLNAPNLKIDHEWVMRGDSNEQITTLSGFAQATSQMQIGALLANDSAHAENIRRADGRIGNFNGNRQQGELYAQYSAENGVRTKVSLFGNNDTVGAGVVFSFFNPLGQTDVMVEYHRPYWDYIEAVLDDSTRDRVALIHTIKPNDKLTISGGPGMSRYNVKDINNVVSVTSVEANVTYRVMDAQPSVSIGYGFDAEYEQNHKKAPDNNGNLTPLYPVRTRELHFVSVNAAYEFTDKTYGDALVGYGYDRFGGSGPAIGGTLTHELTQHLDAQVRAYYGVDTNSTGTNLARIGAYLRWRF